MCELPALDRVATHTTRFHDLRNTCATLLIGRGFNGKFVQELLGHSTIAITLDTYSHFMSGTADHTSVMEDALKTCSRLVSN